MRLRQDGELLRIHISESDRFEGALLHEAILAKCRDMKIAGATVFAGLEGYGESAEVHRAHLVRSDRPIVIVVVDTPEKIRELMPALERMLDTGLMAVSPVRMTRVEKTTSS